MNFKTLLFLFTFGIQFVFAQEKITETEKLVATAKIWGFLKYYHPEVAKGTYNWDKQLFDILPKVEQVQNKDELSQLFYNWVVSLGTVKTCTRCKLDPKKEYFNKNFDLSWTQNKALFSENLSEKLKFIEENRFQGKHHYMSGGQGGSGNVDIKNEPQYNDFDWQNKNLRLLSLFRYWNMVEYFFPYKYQTDQKWDLVLSEMLPKFLNPQSKQDYHLAMLELVAKIDDSHGVFVTKETNNYFGNKWIPADFKIIDNKAIITKIFNDSLTKINDIKIGDVITKVDGRTIADLLQEKQKYIAASNPSVKLRNAYHAVFNGNSDSVTIEYSRKGITQNKTVGRYPFNDFKHKFSQGDTKWNILEGNIGYVNMGNVFVKEVPKMMNELKNSKAIVFDLRNYPQGTLYSIARYLCPKGTDFVKFIEPDMNYPGKFIWRNGTTCGSNGVERYSGKVIVLVNEETQSQAEFTAMSFQTAKDAIIIGSQTAGADGNISKIELVGGFSTYISGIGVFYPDGRETQRIGIVPNIEVKPTIEGIQNNKDEVLEKAILVANSQQ